ncbi:xyloglucan endotransglucosylase protein 1-like [Nymphaea colorata]|nr:xyloglucan endotransglucosylase protein 1-like [Nymphaea colorata]
MQIKLPAGDSAGTVTSFYMSSQGSNHDEIDLEFLGNVTGEPYVLHTNVYTQGQGQREMQFYLWFDPTAAFHTYSILWNPYYILFYVDKMPIRLFSNEEAIGVPYPKNQAMMVYGSIWNADDWATQGGRVKTNWNSAPFVASYSNFKATPCPRQSHDLMRQVDEGTRKTMNLLQKKYMIYNYCTDTRRFPEGLPRECPTENVKFK